MTLTYDNGEGLEFRRTIAIDDKYLFTIKDEVVNKSDKAVSLFPFALISRHGTPQTLGYYILHEGLIGKFGDKGSEEVTYKNVEDKKVINYNATNAWLGITDKYWAAVLVPKTDAHVVANFRADTVGTLKTYQTDYLLDAQTIAPGATATADARLFAGAKEVRVVNDYEKKLDLNHFDLLIDWGWFYFITKPLFFVIDYIYRLVGNFGVAILLVTVLIKMAFFPLANKSYASMAKMKAVQPQMAALNERYPGRQGQAAAGADGALQEGEDQSSGRLSADSNPNSGVLLALQGVVRHHRNAARAVLRLDPRSRPRRIRPTCSTCSASFRSIRRSCRWSAHSCISAPGR